MKIDISKYEIKVIYSDNHWFFPKSDAYGYTRDSHYNVWILNSVEIKIQLDCLIN